MTATIDFDSVASEARSRSLHLVSSWLPDGKKEGSEWVARNPNRDDRCLGSFSVNLETGVWKDFASGDSGSDLVALYAYILGKGQREAAKDLAREFGFQPSSQVPCDPWKPMQDPRPAPPKAAAKPGAEWLPMHLVPEGSYVPPGGHPSQVWTYRDEQGRALFQRPRRDFLKDGKPGKAVTWWACFRTADGALEWKNEAPPSPRPLYGLQDLDDPNREGTLIVEGEKAADAARALFPRMAVLTSGAADSARTSDWSPLRGREDVVLWPDHDEAGQKYVGAVQAELKAQGLNLRVVEVPATWPKKWDLADHPPEGVLPSDFQRMIDQAEPWAGQEEEAFTPAPRALDLLSWSDLKDSPIPPVLWLWEPFFPRVQFGILASHPGHGKSLLSLQLAVGIAAGLHVFGIPTCGPAGAGVLALEDDKNVIHRRLKAIVDAYGQDWGPRQDELLDQNLRVLVRGRTPLEGLDGSAAAHHLAGLAQELGAAMKTTKDAPAVLFLDTLNAVHGGDENSNTEVRALTATIFGLHDALGCSVWALHHLRKAGNGKNGPGFLDRMDPELVRGAGALVGSARAVVQFGWIQPAEAEKTNLDATNSTRQYAVLGLTKINDGPLSRWKLLEHSGNAGLWFPTFGGDAVLAMLRSKKAAEELSQAEMILLDIHKGMTRSELAAKYWPDDEKAEETKLKSAIQDLRRRRKWLQKGTPTGALELTVPGFEKIKELGRQADEPAYSQGGESEHFSDSA